MTIFRIKESKLILICKFLVLAPYPHVVSQHKSLTSLLYYKFKSGPAEIVNSLHARSVFFLFLLINLFIRLFCHQLSFQNDLFKKNAS